MTNFITTTNIFATQTLNSGEYGIVTDNTGIYLGSGDAVTMTGTGRLSILGSAVTMSGNAVKITNGSAIEIKIGADGLVAGGNGAAAIFGGVWASGTFSLNNGGTIDGQVALSAATNSVTTLMNSGTISNSAAVNASAIGVSMTNGTLYLNNTGEISVASSGSTGAIFSGSGTAFVQNSGTISSGDPGYNAIFSAVNLALSNTGTIVGRVEGVGPLANIVNSGTILGSILTGSGNDTVHVSGLVDGAVVLGNGNNTFRLAGGTVTGTVLGGTGDDSYYIDRSDLVIVDNGGLNDFMRVSCDFDVVEGIELTQIFGPTGRHVTGSSLQESIFGASGDDTILGMEGSDSLRGGAGNDLLVGGEGNDSLDGRSGDDVLRGGLGDDYIHASAGADTINGGLGVNDTLNLAPMTSLAMNVVNLTTGTATVYGDDVVTLTGIERVSGSSVADKIIGNGVANWMWGGLGNDILSGGGGNDTLFGSIGADVMSGDAGADVFVFSSTGDSNQALGIDQINGFALAGDVIDLRLVDADPGEEDDSFSFIGENAFSGTGPQVRIVRDGVANTTTIEVQLANSDVIDMSIGLSGNLALTAANFLL